MDALRGALARGDDVGQHRGARAELHRVAAPVFAAQARDDALRTAVDEWLAQAVASGMPAHSLDRAMQRFAAPAFASTPH